MLQRWFKDKMFCCSIVLLREYRLMQDNIVDKLFLLDKSLLLRLLHNSDIIKTYYIN